MADDATAIRALMKRWAGAVHAGDLETVLTDHADDIVMFDVPPPDDGVRGIDAYRETWPPFFVAATGCVVRDRRARCHGGRRRRLRLGPAPLRNGFRGEGLKEHVSDADHAWTPQSPPRS